MVKWDYLLGYRVCRRSPSAADYDSSLRISVHTVS
jgi:hypothetical protein